MIALLANPDSGAGEADEVESLMRELGVEPARFGLDRVDDAVAAGPERIVVAGGDGSIGPAADAAGRASAPLGVVPVGTANDFARALRLPADPREAVRLAATGRRTTALDLGRADDIPFVNAASAGLAPVAARQAHGLKRVLGPVAYTAGALRAGLTAAPVRARVEIDASEAFDAGAWQVIVAVTGAFGGGADVDADPADGRLDVVIVEAGSRLRLIAHAYGLRAGRIERQDGVASARGGKVEVGISGGAGFNVDGEVVDRDRLRIAVEPRAFEVVVGA